MKLNSFSEITDCIQYWKSIRNEPEKVLSYLGQGDAFYFIPQGEKITSNFHVYPGVCPKTDTMYMFLIPAEDDKKSSDEALFNAIIQSVVIKTVGGTPEISELDAKKRINNWNTHYKQWVPEQTKTPDGLFLAFNLPSSYMKASCKYVTYFALRVSSEEITGYRADLVTVDHEEEKARFFDTVRPVPPFDSEYPESSFYLLSC